MTPALPEWKHIGTTRILSVGKSLDAGDDTEDKICLSSGEEGCLFLNVSKRHVLVR